MVRTAISDKVDEIAKSKGMILQDFHAWIFHYTPRKTAQEPGSDYMGELLEIDDVVFVCRGRDHLELLAKFKHEKWFTMVHDMIGF